MVRLMPESLRESCRPVGAEPQARMPEIGARPSVRGERKRRDRQPVGHGEGAAAAPVAGDDFPVRVPDGVAPPIASRREGVMRGEEVAPDAGIDRCRRVAVVLAGRNADHVFGALVERRHPDEARRVLVDLLVVGPVAHRQGAGGRLVQEAILVADEDGPGCVGHEIGVHGAGSASDTGDRRLFA